MVIAPLHDLDRDTPAGLLGALKDEREAVRRSEVAMMVAAVEWAAMHSVDSLDHAMTVPGTDRGLAIAGEGAPLVAEFAIVELAPALGRSADSARLWLGSVLEIRHRLPQVWRRMIDGPLEPWKARQIAGATMLLCPAGAAWVDAQVAPTAHKIGPAQLDRIITEAIRRFDPELAYDREIAAAEHRHVTLHDRDTADGLVAISATLDAIDARDLDQALGKTAHTLLAAGSTESLDVRRALALGEIARHELALDLNTDPTTGEVTGASLGGGAGRDATVYVHLDADTLDLLDDEAALDQPVALIEKTGAARDYTLGIDRLRDWLTRPGTTVTIRPVLDLNQGITSRGYQPSTTLREQIVLRNRVCVFPHCTRSARTADLDHIEPWEHGGTTDSSNLAPLCRLHHRAKTHDRWSYTQLSPGEFLWHSPHHDTYLVDPVGTTTLPAPGQLPGQPPGRPTSRP